MKKMKLILGILFSITILASCSSGVGDNEKDDNKKPEGKLTSIELKLDKSSISVKEGSAVTFSVKDNLGNDVTSDSKFFVNENVIVGNKFSSQVEGEYKVYALYKEIKSDEMTFTVKKEVEENIFVHKVFIEDVTGTWCGYCPYVIEPLEKYSENENFFAIAVHKLDVFSCKEASVFLKTVDGVPAIFFNRTNFKYERGRGYNIYDDPTKKIKEKAPISVGLKTSVIDSEAKVDLKLRFANSFDRPLKVVVMLLENKLIADQKNYLSGKNGYESSRFYKLPPVIKDMEHNHVLRKVATDFMGDLIPEEFPKEAKTYTKSFTIDISSYKKENCDIVAFVVYGDNIKDGAINAQKVKLGSSIFY
ncbi:MAG: Omp28-related outer membrane protein [Marinifilaceae bacterium]|jgi:thiol-disulfide isomerase/thioredoxin|nr:Omp28-related outer membrane protein [Marinifilaceae bacterium]